MLWICVLAFFCGILVSSQYYEFQCNKKIVEEFYPEISCLNGWKCDMSSLVGNGNLTLVMGDGS